MKLSRVREGDLRSLLRNGKADSAHAVSNINYSGLARGVEEPAAPLVNDPGSFSANRNGEAFAETPGKERRSFGHAMLERIVTEAAEARRGAKRICVRRSVR